mgnify:CR=1 FL=1
MINLGGINWELKTLAPDPEFNYEEEFVERKMISGKVRRIYKGKRMTFTAVYGYLTDTQISNLYSLLDSQRSNGYVSATITTPSGTFEGNVSIGIDDSQKRYTHSDSLGWIWTNWVIILTAIDLVK